MSKSFVSKVISPVKRRIEFKRDLSLGIFPMDSDNLYAQRCRAEIDASGSGKPYLELFISFLYGGGFREPLLSKAILNKDGLTGDGLLDGITSDNGYHGGFAVHVNYNALFQKISYSLVPFEFIRLKIPQDDKAKVTQIAIYSDWEKKKKLSISAEDLDIVDLYDPRPEVILKQVEEAGGWENYKGQVFYFTGGQTDYPKPVYDCVLEDLRTDYGIKVFKTNTVNSGFAGSHIFVNKGKLKPESRKQLEEDIEEFQDPENAGSILMVDAENENQIPQLIPIERNYDDKLHTVTRKTTKEDIMGAFFIPPALLLQNQINLGSPQYNEAVDMYNVHTAKYRLKIETALAELFKNSIIPGTVVKDYGIQPTGGVQSGILLSEKILPHFMNLMGLQIPSQNKINILITVFGFSEEDAKFILTENQLPKP